LAEDPPAFKNPSINKQKFKNMTNLSKLVNDNQINLVDYMQRGLDLSDGSEKRSATELAQVYDYIGSLFNLSDGNFKTTHENFIEIVRITKFFLDIQKASKRYLSDEEIKSFLLPYKFEGLYFVDISILCEEINGMKSLPPGCLFIFSMVKESKAVLNINDKTYFSEVTMSIYQDILDYFNNVTLKKKASKYNTYIFKDNSAGLYKIGRSTNPESRHQTIYTSNPSASILMICDQDIESELHKKYFDKKVTREWFSLSDSDLQEIFERFKAIGGKFFDVKTNGNEK